MSQEMTQKKESVLAFFRLVVGFLKLHFRFILFESITKKELLMNITIEVSLALSGETL